MARRVLPSRLELKRPDGSSSAAPLAKVMPMPMGEAYVTATFQELALVVWKSRDLGA
jgi:hypothetical protein